MIKQIHHYGFTVSDLQASLRFYRDTLGFTVVRQSERKDLPAYDRILGFRNVHILMALLSHPAQGFLLELFQYVNPPATPRTQSNHYVGSSHCAFEVEDIERVYAALIEAGYSTISPPVDIVRDGVRVARACYALDPDGISVELLQTFADLSGR